MTLLSEDLLQELHIAHVMRHAGEATMKCCYITLCDAQVCIGFEQTGCDGICQEGNTELRHRDLVVRRETH